jgi:hypothetical protein
MYACLCIRINSTTQHILATGTGTGTGAGAVLINKRDERCTLRLGVHHHHLRSAHEQSARPVKDSIRADDDGEEVACGSINLRASGDARVRL